MKKREPSAIFARISAARRIPAAGRFASLVVVAACLVIPALVVPSDSLATEQIYQHPLGYFFRYPGSWTLQETEDALMLVPGDAVRDESGELMEIVLISSEDAPGIKSAKDSQVASFFDQEYKTAFPGLTRTGETEDMVTALGPGVVFTYEGEIEGGVPSMHRVHVVVRDETGIFLVHMARSDLVVGRMVETARIFGGFGHEAPVAKPKTVDQNIDTEIVRFWSRSSFEGSSGSGGQISATSNLTYEFFADGTVIYGSRTRMGGNTDGLGVVLNSDSGPNTYRGVFTTSDNVLRMTWESGSEEVYEYKVFLDHEGVPALKLHADGEKPEYWQ